MSRRSHVVDPPSKVDTPITAFLDLSFQLLFFFVATYNPNKRVEGSLDMSLPTIPQEKSSDNPVEKPPPSPEEKLDLSVNLTVVVKTPNLAGDTAGTINEIFTESESDPRNSLPRKDGGGFDFKVLQERLEKAAKESGPEKKRIVKVKADPDLRLSELVKVMDPCKEIGFKVSFVKPEPRPKRFRN